MKKIEYDSNIISNQITLKELKEECINRMKILKLKDNIIESFRNENTIYVSHIKDKIEKATEEDMSLIKEYEIKKNIKIYHIIKQKTESKHISIFLYVDANSNDWNNERRDIRLGYDCGIVYTKTKEIKEVGILSAEGSITRIYI